MLDLYPYHNVPILPHLAYIEADQAFAVFINSRRIQYDIWHEIELKKFYGTIESLEYGELLYIFRKCDGFLVTRPKENIVVLKTKVKKAKKAV